MIITTEKTTIGHVILRPSRWYQAGISVLFCSVPFRSVLFCLGNFLRLVVGQWLVVGCWKLYVGSTCSSSFLLLSCWDISHSNDSATIAARMVHSFSLQSPSHCLSQHLFSMSILLLKAATCCQLLLLFAAADDEVAVCWSEDPTSIVWRRRKLKSITFIDAVLERELEAANEIWLCVNSLSLPKFSLLWDTSFGAIVWRRCHFLPLLWLLDALYKSAARLLVPLQWDSTSTS